MATCKDCFHYEACSGFNPTDLDKDVWHYCEMGIPEEIPDIDQRCDNFKDSNSWAEVVRCKDCKFRKSTFNGDGYFCSVWDTDDYEEAYVKDNDFCSYGERKDNVL